MQPLIGISCGTFHDRAWCPPSFGHRQTYVDAVLKAGGAPLLIPPVQDEHVLRTLYDQLDGLLLAGGGDLSPALYGAEPHEKLGLLDPLRDGAEMPLARWALAEGKPVFGICRGIQVLNVARGGTLYQDIPSELITDLQHDISYAREDWTHMAHELHLAPDSQLAYLLGTEQLAINSLHHQAVRTIGAGLRPVGWAPDGVVEALEGTGEAFVLGVQCHPEALQAHADPRWQAVFAAFVARCRATRQVPALAA
ncbi:gamma-glutamyl-gamma-aminobutyrate hydrolase family protein [Candidatus Chloroploca asiatica]|uniref:Gamma-glutamyl-gamma-aminobutyrate hydrolase n=1 Tax=Candidatus Chloroploca asiatica TaxID=1506545 RepID=A0A2H3KPC0_9CHLR|nr:gamma-glutamyl-gamma-aminobutyrate hydrolase family protein [Candidatus Chloroploca asiatica]PDW00080.1 gamma-glutamyl-gamma-aminobutyrate hydrolase [Candidatus Chloroploca asiatica]